MTKLSGSDARGVVTNGMDGKFEESVRGMFVEQRMVNCFDCMNRDTGSLTSELIS